MVEQPKKPVPEPVPELTSASDESSKPIVRVGEKPHFVRCQIVGPDGKKRSGWELWIGEHCFGRSDRKELLVRSLERQQQPPQSFHWREVHRQRFNKSQEQEEPHDHEEPQDQKTQDDSKK